MTLEEAAVFLGTPKGQLYGSELKMPDKPLFYFSHFLKNDLVNRLVSTIFVNRRLVPMRDPTWIGRPLSRAPRAAQLRRTVRA